MQHRRVHIGRAHHVGGDCAVRVFEGHGFDETDDTPFRGRIVGQVRGALPPTHRRDGDNRAGVACHQMGQRGANTVKRAGQVGGQHIGPECVGQFGGRRESDDTGAGDENIDAAGFRGDRIDQRRHRCRVTDIEHSGTALPAVGFDDACGLGEIVAGCQRVGSGIARCAQIGSPHRGAAPGQCARDRAALSTPGAGDQCGARREVACGYPFSHDYLPRMFRPFFSPGLWRFSRRVPAASHRGRTAVPGDIRG